ncbi:MAG: hypothetical protein KIT22_06220 [Verrucomicrobiae bacterium]|nr:hypothetical protein [Verrucomicrobiae bacterium]
MAMQLPIARLALPFFAGAFLVNAAQQMVLVAGGGTNEAENVPALEARLKEPFGVEQDRQGNLFIVEMSEGQRVRRVGQDGRIRTVAGTGVKGMPVDSAPALEARFNGIHNLAIGQDDLIYLADTFNGVVRTLDLTAGVVRRYCGAGGQGDSGDGGPALAARVGSIFCVTFDPPKTKLYLADLPNARVRVIDAKTGRIDAVAGNGRKGIPTDGALAKESPLVDPRAVAADSKGNVYILERNGHALRVVSPDGRIRTVVNASGRKGATGDGGPALEATMNGPKHLCVDREDNVLIADAENHLIRKYLPKEGRIVRVAGTGKQGAAGVGGPPEQCELNRPHGVYVGPTGTVFITDSYNHRILKIAE